MFFFFFFFIDYANDPKPAAIATPSTPFYTPQVCRFGSSFFLFHKFYVFTPLVHPHRRRPPALPGECLLNLHNCLFFFVVLDIIYHSRFVISTFTPTFLKFPSFYPPPPPACPNDCSAPKRKILAFFFFFLLLLLLLLFFVYVGWNQLLYIPLYRINVMVWTSSARNNLVLFLISI